MALLYIQLVPLYIRESNTFTTCLKIFVNTKVNNNIDRLCIQMRYNGNIWARMRGQLFDRCRDVLWHVLLVTVVCQHCCHIVIKHCFEHHIVFTFELLLNIMNTYISKQYTIIYISGVWTTRYLCTKSAICRQQ